MITHNINGKKIFFSKMHGLKNDFMVVDCINQEFYPSSSIIRKLSNRHTGIGFDQLLLVEKTDSPLYDFYYRIFNSNGNEVEQCGNGARCFGLFVVLKKLTDKKRIVVKTKTRLLIIELMSDNMIKVNMEEPDFTLHNMYLSKKVLYENFSVKILNKSLTCRLVSIGNPHCVIKVDSITNAPVKIVSNYIKENKIFLKGINIGFMEIINKNYIKLRVYERDVGETYSCGSGACAAVAIGISQNILSDNVQVELLGGKLIVQWKGLSQPLYMIGPAEHIYDGYVDV